MNHASRLLLDFNCVSCIGLQSACLFSRFWIYQVLQLYETLSLWISLLLSLPLSIFFSVCLSASTETCIYPTGPIFQGNSNTLIMTFWIRCYLFILCSPKMLMALLLPWNSYHTKLSDSSHGSSPEDETVLCLTLYSQHIAQWLLHARHCPNCRGSVKSTIYRDIQLKAISIS